MTVTLPAPGSAWPPSGHAARYDRMRRPAAWYSGDPGQLAGAYGVMPQQLVSTAGNSYNAPGIVRRVTSAIRSAFWMSGTAELEDTKRHLPVAEDIARASSRHLFSERIRVRVVDPSPGANGEASEVAMAAQRRLDYLMDANGIHATLLAAAEVASALGCAPLRIVWDRSVVPDRPLLVRADPFATVPYYSFGQLAGVAFWTIVQRDEQAIWRHIELHAGGKVSHGLYKGDADSIGDRMPLAAHPVTAALEGGLNADGELVVLADGGTTAISVPNMLPDPLDPMAAVGRSDFTPAVMDLFDAIDRAYSQMMEALEDARSRLLIAEHMLGRGGPGEALSYNADQRIYTKLRVPPGEKEGSSLPIEQVQFEMRLAEYLQGIDALTRKAVEAAGYNVRSDAGEGGRDVTATEVASDDSKSMATRDVKVLYWQPQLAAILTSLLAVDVKHFSGRDPQTGQVVQALPVTVSFPETSQPTLLELAQTAQALREAGAASTMELVRTVRPDWTDKQVGDEVDRIMASASVIDPVSFGTGGGGL